MIAPQSVDEHVEEMPALAYLIDKTPGFSAKFCETVSAERHYGSKQVNDVGTVGSPKVVLFKMPFKRSLSDRFRH